MVDYIDVVQPEIRTQKDRESAERVRQYQHLLASYENEIEDLSQANKDLRRLLLVIMNKTKMLKISKSELTEVEDSMWITTQYDARDESVTVRIHPID